MTSIAIRQESDVMLASMSVMRLAQKMGMSAVESTMCATAASELATNIVRYADYGDITIHAAQDTLQLTASDHGPGIKDVELAMQEGHSGGTGLGMGLSGIARIMDSMDIQTTQGEGTSVTISKALRKKETKSVLPSRTKEKHLDAALLLRPILGESVSGDGGLILDIPSYRFMALWDISGHGQEAHDLSKKVDRFIRQRKEKPPHILLRDVHEKFRGTRGLVAVIARLSPATGLLEYAGIGNISLLHLSEYGMRRLPLQEGVMGYQIRTPKSERLQLHSGDTLLMHSDGIHTIRDELKVFQYTTAADIADTIVEDFRAKQSDDASCLVLRYRI